jgi:hypothetical protein
MEGWKETSKSLKKVGESKKDRKKGSRKERK